MQRLKANATISEQFRFRCDSSRTLFGAETLYKFYKGPWLKLNLTVNINGPVKNLF